MLSPLIIHDVTLRNFQSYGANLTHVKLDTVGTTLIVGEDLDNSVDGEGANGVGKSTIVNAVVYALYGKPIDSKISLDSLVNNINKKNMEVSCTFSVDGHKYVVKRTRKSKAGAAGNTCKLEKDGKDITPDSMDACTALIVRIIGIPYDIFTRIVVFSATHTPFLSLPTRSPTAVNQSDIIEDLFGLTILTDKANLLKKKIADTELQLDTLKTIAKTQEAERKRFDQSIVNAKKRILAWEAENDEKIEALSKKLDMALSIDIDEQIRLYAEYNELTELRNTIVRTKQSTKKNVDRITKELDKAKHELSHLTDEKCPYCLQDFAGAEAKIQTCESEIARLSQLVSEQQTEVDAASAAEQEHSAKLNDLEQRLVVDNAEELLVIKNQSEFISQEIETLKLAPNPFLDVLAELEEMSVADIDYTEINKLTKLIEHQKFLLKLLTKNDSFLRKKLLNKNIPYLNERLSLALSQLGLTHKVEFTHEMTAQISQFGRELDFSLLSAGQKARVNLALSWAFRDVYQKRYRKVNLSMLDEALDTGLDGVGVQAAVKMLKRKTRDEGISMFVISHRSDDVGNAFDRRITVQLSKGFSQIVSDTKEEE